MSYINKLLDAIREREAVNPPNGFVVLINNEYLHKMCDEDGDKVAEGLGRLIQKDDPVSFYLFGHVAIVDNNIDKFFVMNSQVDLRDVENVTG